MGLKLNLGSGQRPFQKPWINVDIEERWKPDVVADCSNMPMFEDNSAELIVCHQTLEHYGCGEGAGMIKECYRILQPGGSLLVFVPDMRAICQRWLVHQMDTQLFMTSVYGAYMGDDHDRHKWGYEFESLRVHLQGCAPWENVLSFDRREIEGASIALAWWVLAMEAVK